MIQADESASTCPPFRQGTVATDATLQVMAGYPDLLTVRHLRKLTGLSEQTIRVEINRGNLPGCRIGRRLYVPKQQFIRYVMEGGGLDAQPRI